MEQNPFLHENRSIQSHSETKILLTPFQQTKTVDIYPYRYKVIAFPTTINNLYSSLPAKKKRLSPYFLSIQIIQ